MKNKTILDIIYDEVRNIYPIKFNTDYNEFLNENNYNIHCSQIIANAIRSAFLSVGFLINGPNGEVIDDTIKILKYQSPSIGKFTLIIDMEQGYKIEKV